MIVIHRIGSGLCRKRLPKGSCFQRRAWCSLLQSAFSRAAEKEEKYGDDGFFRQAIPGGICKGPSSGKAGAPGVGTVPGTESFDGVWIEKCALLKVNGERAMNERQIWMFADAKVGS
jgi:hypothetical protein